MSEVKTLTNGEKLDRLAKALDTVMPMMPDGDLQAKLRDIRESVSFSAPENWRLWLGEAATALAMGQDDPGVDAARIREAWLTTLGTEPVETVRD